MKHIERIAKKIKYVLLNILCPRLPNKDWVFINRVKGEYYSICLDMNTPDDYGFVYKATSFKWERFDKCTLEELYRLTTVVKLDEGKLMNIFALFKSGLGYGYVRSVKLAIEQLKFMEIRK